MTIFCHHILESCADSRPIHIVSLHYIDQVPNLDDIFDSVWDSISLLDFFSSSYLFSIFVSPTYEDLSYCSKISAIVLT